MAIASGTCGTCTWSISDSGDLTIAPTSGSSGYLLRHLIFTGYPWQEYADQIKTATFSGTIRFYTVPWIGDPAETGNAEGLFCVYDSGFPSESGYKNLTSITGFSSLKGLKNISRMFDWCKALSVLDLSGLDTTAVEAMTGLFAGCSLLSSVTFDSSFSTEAAIPTSGKYDLPDFGKGTNLTNGVVVQNDEAFFKLTTAQRAGTWERGVAPMYEVEAYRITQGSPDEGGDDVRINMTWATDAETSTRTLTIYKKLNSDPTYPNVAIVTRNLSGNSGREEITIQDIGSEAYDFKVQFYDGTNTFIAFPSIQSNIELITIDPDGNVWAAGNIEDGSGNVLSDALFEDSNGDVSITRNIVAGGSVTENNGTRDIDLQISETTIQAFVDLGMSLT